MLYMHGYVHSFNRPLVVCFTKHPIFAEIDDVMADTISFLKYTILLPDILFVLFMFGFAMSWYTNIDLLNL